MGVNAQHAIVAQPRMHMDVEVRHLLKRCFTDRMPKADTVVRKSCANRPGNPGYGRHQRRTSHLIQFPDVSQMLSRDH